jgi:hypothetical protein
MRTFVRLILLCISLSMLVRAACAQPTPQHPPARDARCKAASYRYESITSDKAHRTVEEQSWVEYDEAKKYLRLCWESDDDFTRNLKKYVSRREDYARCDEAWARLGPEFKAPDGTLVSIAGWQKSYRAAKEFLRVCDSAETEGTRSVKLFVETYETFTGSTEAINAYAALVLEVRKGGASSATYARLAESIVKAMYEPRHRFLVKLVERGKSPDSEEVRKAWAEVSKALDSIVATYARAIALCEEGDGCQVAKGGWEESLAKFYALRHDGSEEGLRETIANGRDARIPFP